MDIRGVFLLTIGLVCLVLVMWWWRRLTLRSVAHTRVMQEVSTQGPVRPEKLSGQTYPSRYRWVPIVLGVLTGWSLWYGLGLALPFAAGSGLMIGILGYLLEAIVAEKRLSQIEIQLAEAIDLMVGALHAGLSLSKALDTARKESKLPLRRYLNGLVRKIRLGEDPSSAVRELSDLVPLETFQLFSLTLSAQWWTGGSLAPTLAGVGRTIRDRIELSRRVRTQGVEAKVSVIGVLAISYVLAVILWRANPHPIENFFTSEFGTTLAGAAIALQAVGILWINRMSQVKF